MFHPAAQGRLGAQGFAPSKLRSFQCTRNEHQNRSQILDSPLSLCASASHSSTLEKPERGTYSTRSSAEETTPSLTIIDLIPVLLPFLQISRSWSAGGED